jgi:hypothetical protein
MTLIITLTLTILLIGAIILILGLILSVSSSPSGGINDSCNNNSECLQGLVCQTNLCKVPLGELCSSNNDCVVNTTCINGTCQKNTLNNPCTSDAQCSNGYTCSNNLCKIKIGNACFENLDCETNTCSGVCVNQDRTLNQSCDSTNLCIAPLICNQNICKIPDGNSCTSENQCLPNRVCDSTCQIAPSENMFCTDHGLCSSFLHCEKYKLMENDTLVYTSSKKILDVVEYNDNLLILLEDNTILNINENNRITITNNIKLDKIDTAFDQLLGLSEGKLVRRYNVNNYSFLWEEVISDNFFHISVTLNGKYIWLQNEKSGILLDENFNVIQRKELEGIRIYGKSKNTYLQINSKTKKGIVYPSGKKVMLEQGFLTEEGKVESVKNLSYIKYRNRKKFSIKKRTCIK